MAAALLLWSRAASDLLHAAFEGTDGTALQATPQTCFRSTVHARQGRFGRKAENKSVGIISRFNLNSLESHLRAWSTNKSTGGESGTGLLLCSGHSLWLSVCYLEMISNWRQPSSLDFPGLMLTWQQEGKAPLQKAEYVSLMMMKMLPLTIAVMKSFRIKSSLLYQSLMAHILLRWDF